MHRVVIVGSSLFADTLSQMFAGSDNVEVVGSVSDLDQLSLCINACNPDAVLVADTGGEYLSAKTCLRVTCNLPIIYTTLNDDHFTVFTTRRVKAAQAQLLSAIAALPKKC